MYFTLLSYSIRIKGVKTQLPSTVPYRSFTLSQRFLTPLELALSRADHSRECTDYSDNTYLHSGVVGRVLEASRSGREWVQRFNACHDQTVSVNNFFAALKSDRRLSLLRENDLDIRQQERKRNMRSKPLNALMARSYVYLLQRKPK